MPGAGMWTWLYEQASFMTLPPYLQPVQKYYLKLAANTGARSSSQNSAIDQGHRIRTYREHEKAHWHR